MASGVSFLILDQLEFNAGQDNSDMALNGLIVLYALVPCIIKLIAALYLWQVFIKKGDNKDEHTQGTHDYGAG